MVVALLVDLQPVRARGHALVLLIEVGFLLAYRHGGALQWSAVAVNGAAALLVLPVALLFFQERFTISKSAGVVLVLGGMALMARKCKAGDMLPL